jgi:hypothetical protein
VHTARAALRRRRAVSRSECPAPRTGRPPGSGAAAPCVDPNGQPARSNLGRGRVPSGCGRHRDFRYRRPRGVRQREGTAYPHAPWPRSALRPILTPLSPQTDRTTPGITSAN